LSEEVRRLPGDPPSPWEEQFGFSRIVEAGGFVRIGGTTSVGVGGVIVGETPYEQAAAIFAQLEHELGRAGLGMSDVIEVSVYVTDISRGAEVGRAFSEVFAQVGPLMTMVEVSALIDPRMLVEVSLIAHRS
jgi:enamine deaminase RidA (YjgF/YER057c/UK114 family)